MGSLLTHKFEQSSSNFSLPGSAGASSGFFLRFWTFLAGDWEVPWDVCWLWHSSGERVPTILATFAQYPAKCLGQKDTALKNTNTYTRYSSSAKRFTFSFHWQTKNLLFELQKLCLGPLVFILLLWIQRISFVGLLFLGLC